MWHSVYCHHSEALFVNIHEGFSSLTSFYLQDLQCVVQQQRADMDSARDALSSLCRFHPSQELSGLSSELTSFARRTEAVAQRCAETRDNLQDGLQFHFNGT